MPDERGLRARPPTREDIARFICPTDPAYDLADALLAEFSIVARGDTPPAPAIARTEPHLDDACECGHTFGYHCTPEFPNGGYCAASATASPGYGCSCTEFRPRGVTPDPQTADAAFEKWCKQHDLEAAGSFEQVLRVMFSEGFSARAAVGDSPPAPAETDANEGAAT